MNVALRERVRKMRAEGFGLNQIAHDCHQPKLKVKYACQQVRVTTDPIVAFDKSSDCWRIWIYEKPGGEDAQGEISRWPLSWMQFATKGAAEQHLNLYGAA